MSWEDFCSEATLIKQIEARVLSSPTVDTNAANQRDTLMQCSPSTGDNTWPDLPRYKVKSVYCAKWAGQHERTGWRFRTLKELCTSVSSRSMTTQIFPWSWSFTAGRRQSSCCCQDRTDTHLSTGVSAVCTATAWVCGCYSFPELTFMSHMLHNANSWSTRSTN